MWAGLPRVQLCSPLLQVDAFIYSICVHPLLLGSGDAGNVGDNDMIPALMKFAVW